MLGEELSGSADTLEKADVALGTRLAADRDKPVVKAVAWVGKVADQGPLYAIGAAFLVIGCSSRRGRLAAAGISMLAAVGMADAGKSLTKRMVKRTRPHVLLEEGHYAAEAGGSDRKPEQSFPSGHVAGSVAAARALTRIFPEARPWPMLVAAALGVTRVLKGAHWPLDLVAGAVIGLIAEAVTSSLLGVLIRMAQPRKRR